MQWEKFANQFAVERSGHRYPGSGKYRNVGDAEWVRLFGAEIFPVLVTEDPEGDYWGWRRQKKPEDSLPSHIWYSRVLLQMCFPNSLESAVELGQGEVVRLRIRSR